MAQEPKPRRIVKQRGASPKVVRVQPFWVLLGNPHAAMKEIDCC